MDQIRSGYQPGDFNQRHNEDHGPLREAEPPVAGWFLPAVFVLCIGFWLLLGAAVDRFI